MESKLIEKENPVEDRLITKWSQLEQSSDIKPISRNQENYWNMPKEWLIKCSELSISRLDGFLLSLVFGFESGWINSVVSTQNLTLTPIQDEIITHFEKALIKLPKTNGEIVYRMDNYSSTSKEVINWWNLNIGKIIEMPFFLGTSMEDWENTDVIWRIKTLSGNSKGYKTFLFQDQALEKEVRFLRNSKFLVESISKGDNATYVHLVEVSNDTSTDSYLNSNSYYLESNR